MTDDFQKFLDDNGIEKNWFTLEDLERMEKDFFKGFLQRYNDQEKAAFKTIWKAADVPFLDFIKYPQDYRDPSSGNVSGLIYYDDTIPVGKELLSFALNKANEYGYGIDFFIQDNEIDYNKTAWFCYEVFIIDLIDYHSNLMEGLTD